ncbi:MAG: hypothetical protein FH749_15175 [Firmicutes bacterium]|nr:hypothetical protein [Bacillota bacterium]
MRLVNFAWKNASGNPWRALALGTFIFLASFVLLVSNAFFSTVMGNIENSLINSLTGHIQVRSELT